MLRRLVPIAILVSIALGTVDAAERPNIVYVMADELGYYELSCMGNPHIKTPNIDRMAKEGVRFTQALAGSSLCAPTRCVFLTGKHTGHTSVRTNGGGTPLRAEEQTVASLLKTAGYATGGFGKWGCGGRGSTGVPEDHGFDVFLGYYDQVHAHSYFPPYIVRNSTEIPLAGNKGGSDGETYSHYVIVDGAMDFIRENREQPFFCYMPITPPHGIFDIPDDDPAWKQYADQDWPEQAKRYAAMVTMVDRQVGELFALLKKLELDEKTIVFFSGDNGGADYFRDAKHPRGFHGANVHPATGVEFRGKKGNLYEGGLRIPMVVRWPGHIEPNRTSDLLWSFQDVLPTLTELAGVKTPDDVDGMSILPELIGADSAGREQAEHEFLYWELGQQTAVRTARWKAIKPRQNAAWELYDLEKDVSEAHDVAEDHPDVLAKMQTFAKKSHEPAVEGIFHDREIHEKDRRAKFGGRAPSPPGRVKGKVNALDPKGLLPNDGWKLVEVSSESKSNGKLAANAIDGDPRTHWHTSFAGEKPDAHPHEFVIDLGRTCEIRGFRYLARQDNGWNGAVAKCEFAVSTSAEDFAEVAVTATLKKVRTSQEARCDPVRGRYVRVRVLSEVNGGPWASAAEIGVVGESSKEQE